MTTIQDLGRVGFQQYGVVVGGVMDEMAAKIANLLLGNDEGDAVLELTLIGPSLSFETDQLISICGADLTPAIDGISVPLWRPVFVRKGSLLSFGRPKKGCRSYLAVAGGFEVPVVMNSRSTYIRGGFGGYNGRALKKEDLLCPREELGSQSLELLSYLKDQNKTTSFQTVSWAISTELKPHYVKDPIIRFIKGPQFDDFTKDAKRRFLTHSFQVTPQSDRMGYRLSGERLELQHPLNLLSVAVTMGTIQVPNDGQPIILMSDRQTIGGYPKIGYVASVDLPTLSQVMPGEKINFKEISLQESQSLLLKREAFLKELTVGISLAIRRMKDGAD